MDIRIYNPADIRTGILERTKYVIKKDVWLSRNRRSIAFRLNEVNLRERALQKVDFYFSIDRQNPETEHLPACNRCLLNLDFTWSNTCRNGNLPSPVCIHFKLQFSECSTLRHRLDYTGDYLSYHHCIHTDPKGDSHNALSNCFGNFQSSRNSAIPPSSR